MIRKFSLAVVFFLAGALAVLAGEPVQPVYQDIAGHKYVLIEVDGTEFQSERQPFIEFLSEQAIAGRVCNQYRGPVTLEEGVLRAGPIMATRMYCPMDGLSDVESRLFQLLENGVPVRVDGDRLILADGGRELVFVREKAQAGDDEALIKALSGRRFFLRSVNGEPFAVVDEARPFIEFGEDNRIFGSACNNFSGAAKVENGTLFMENAISTMKLCADPGLNDFEGMFHRMMNAGVEVILDGGTLVLKGNDARLEYAE